MDDWLAVLRGNFHGGVSAARRRSADEQRQFETLAFHFARDVHHFVERGGDQAAEADHVGLFRFGALENSLARHHHAQIDHVIVVAGQNDAYDIFADVVHVTFHCRQDDFSLRFDNLSGRALRRLLGLHKWGEVSDRFFHHAGRLYDLREKHLAGAKQIADDAHASHQRAFNDQQRPPELDARFFRVPLDVGVDSLYQCVRKALFYSSVAPLFRFLFGGSRASAL